MFKEETDNLVEFNNVEEIKFTKIRDNIFSLSINSDIKFQNKTLKGFNFNTNLCKIDSPFELKHQKEYSQFKTSNGYVLTGETMSIPINIRVLLDKDVEEFFTICENK